MKMSGEQRIEASVERVWEALNDPDVLKASIPGCDSLEKKSDTELAATVTLKIGPVKAKFNAAGLRRDDGSFLLEQAGFPEPVQFARQHV